MYLAKSTAAGRGVFAKEDIKAGEIIEEAPVIIIPPDQLHELSKDLFRFAFAWGIDQKHATTAIALGYGSLYNHSDFPNATFHPAFYNKTMVYTAIKDIKKDEEIFITYGYSILKNLFRTRGSIDSE
ncbi:SET domain-containing protein-lysine N-methyltransferase [Candidatus Daviesbacteria bacterium]|nr:SET domain-containing protein-lysine N-methyltransferase [Candidatus Daviesbacteria bacterium]